MTGAPLPTVSADYFLAFVEDAIARHSRHLGIADVEVAGDVELSGWRFRSGLCIERIRFRDPVRMHNCEFGNELNLKDCAFDGPLDLSNAVIGIDLKISGCRFGLEEAGLARPLLILDGATVTGDMQFREIEVNGVLSALRIQIRGDIWFQCCKVEADADRAALDFGGAEVSGIIKFEQGCLLQSDAPFAPLYGEYAPQSYLGRRSVFIDRRGRTVLSLRHAKARTIALTVARFEGSLDCHHLECGALTSTVLEMRPDEAIQPSRAPIGGAHVTGDLMLSGGSYGLIRLLGITIKGHCKLFDGKSGQIEIGDGMLDAGDGRVFVVPSRLGNFFMSRWHCHDFIRLHPAQISGSRDERGWRGVYILSCQIDRRLCLWPGQGISQTLQQYFDPNAKTTDTTFTILENAGDAGDAPEPPMDARQYVNRWKRSLTVHGRVNLKHCTIGEDLVLTGIQVEEPDDAGGCIEALHCDVRGNVKFDSPASYLASPEHDSAVLQLCARYLMANKAAGLPGGDAFATARCDGVDFSDLKGERVELSGLKIRPRKAIEGEACPADDISPDEGEVDDDDGEIGPGVNLQSAEIGRRLATFARMSVKQVGVAIKEVHDVIEAGRPHYREFRKPSPPPPPASSGSFPAELTGPLPQHEDRQLHVLVACFGMDDIKLLAEKGEIWPVEIELGAGIPGSLNLRHATIDEFVVSDASFCEKRRGSKPAKNGIVLSYAKVNKLYVARRNPALPKTPEHNGFPVPLDLLDLEVRSWFLEGAKDPPRTAAFVDREATAPDCYLDLLDNDLNFRMSSYLAIERSLRDRGLDSEARRIFIAGRYRDMREEPERAVKKSDRGRSMPGSAASHWWSNLALWSWLSWRPAWWSQTVVWRPGDGRYRRENMAFAVRRLVRPSGEYYSLLICFGWILAGAGFFGYFGSIWGTQNVPILVAAFVAFMILGVLLFRKPVVVFIDHLYWSVIDYGTSAARLAIVIGLLMLASFVLATDRVNFEPTLAARSELTARQLLDADLRTQQELARPPGERRQAVAAATRPHLDREWGDNQRPTDQNWPIAERVWMTLRYHVPLVDAVTSEEWQPAIGDMNIRFLSPVDGGTRPTWWPDGLYWPRARDWFGFMLWANWVLWPLFLPFLIRILTRSK
jgi:hypothetical protein